MDYYKMLSVSSFLIVNNIIIISLKNSMNLEMGFGGKVHLLSKLNQTEFTKDYYGQTLK